MMQDPNTMISPETGEVLHRGVRGFPVTYKGRSIEVDLPGYYPVGEGDGVHVGSDMVVVDDALRRLREEIDGIPAPSTIRNLRSKLKLSQRKAGLLFGVGERAFDKYERGLVMPSGPAVKLMKLLDRHPELVKELES
jgi:HTH-type transcriptional regulator/antitoxin MqsA